MRNLFFLILFLSHTGFAQESIVRLWHEGNRLTKFSSEKALVVYQQAFDEAVKQKNLLWQANICVDQCGALFDKGDFNSAIERCQLGINTLNNEKIKNDSIQFKLYSALGACYKSVYNLKESFKSFEQANLIFHKNPELEKAIPLYVTFHYANQGSTWLTLGDPERAFLYYQKALSLLEKSSSKSYYSVVLIKLSSIYKFKKDFAKAIETIEMAIANYKIDGKLILDTYLAEAYLNLGECYLKIGNYKLAIQNIKKSKKVARINLPQNIARRLIFQIDILLADIMLRQGDIERPKIIYEKILSQNLSSGYYHLNLNFLALRGLSEIEIRKENYSKALVIIQKALSEVSGTKIKDELKNPERINSMYAALGISSVVDRKVETLMKLYSINKNVKYLKSAVETQRLSVDIAKRLRQSHETIESKALFSHLYYAKYEKLIELSFELLKETRLYKYSETSFDIMEESKSIMLSDNLALQNSYRNAGSDSLIVKLKANQAYLAYLIGSSEKNSELIKTYELKINQILEKLSIVNRPYVESFKSEFKKHALSFPQQISYNSMYLNYSLIENKVYVSCVKKNQISIKCINIKPDEFRQNKDLLKAALTTNPGPYSGFNARKSAAYFYDILIRPFEKELKGIDNLIINPDNEMIEISFDILVPHEKSNDYLIKKYNISYLNSALNYNDKLANKFSRADRNWLSFAPFGSKTKNSNELNIQNLTILPSTIKEINGIKGQAIINEKSTKQTFVKTISELKDRVILIATHASENNGEPYLNFFPANDNYKLYANEIQYLDFKTPLVILGACESNAGKKMKGSGVLSIAKAFSIGGCPAVVGSLWEVHDESMAVLVSLFYKHLMRGERKDVALRLAKLEYLETETGLRNDPPYYWAHLQIIGDVSPLIVWPVMLRYAMYGLMVVIISLSIIYGIRSRKRFFN